MHDNSHGELHQFQTLLTFSSTWLIDTLLSPYQAKKGVRESTQSHSCFTCNVSREALSDAGLGDSYKPQKFTSYWCSICKRALCIDPCFRLYHTKEDYTSEILKIARMSVKPVQKMLNMFKQMLNMSNEATQSKWDDLTAWAYSTYSQVPESMIYHV